MIKLGEVMMQASVSIIVPVYNAETSIERCIQSIQAQTYKNWKLLLIDDGSTDRSPQICKHIALSDTRILYYRKENGGVSSARNYAMDRIDTPFFVCIDSDDFVEPDYLLKLLETKKLYPQAGHIWCCFQTVSSPDKDNAKVFVADANVKYSTFDRKEVMTLYKLWLLQMPWHKLYDTSIVDENYIRMDETLSLSEDLLFNLQYLDCCSKTQIVVINCPLYNYVRGEKESLDHKYRKDLIETFRKSNTAKQYYLNKWKVGKNQKQIFYDVRFYNMEKVLRNTFHPDNRMTFFKKLKYNNQLLESDEFQNIIAMRKCYIHPWILRGYKEKQYAIILLVGWISKIKHSLSRYGKR